VIFLRDTAGNENVGVVSSVMAGVAQCNRWQGVVSATKSYAASSA
jgi:hypothetical protein